MKPKYHFRAWQYESPQSGALQFQSGSDPVGNPSFTCVLEQMSSKGGIWVFAHDWQGMLIDPQALEEFLSSTGLQLHLEEAFGFDRGILYRPGESDASTS